VLSFWMIIARSGVFGSCVSGLYSMLVIYVGISVVCSILIGIVVMFMLGVGTCRRCRCRVGVRRFLGRGFSSSP